MDLRALEMFLAVAEWLSFRRASEHLHVAESAISRKVRLLEEELGELLFKRVKKKVYLTLAGEALQINARKVFQDLRNARLEVSDVAHNKRGHIRIAAVLLASIYFLPSILRKFKTLYPAIEVEIITGSTEGLISMIRDNSAEIGILTLPIRHPELEVIPLLAEKMVVATSNRFRNLRGKRSISAKEISSYPLILPSERSYTGRILRTFFRDAGITPQISMIVDNALSVKPLVEQGIGITILPLPAVMNEVKRGELHTLKIEDHNLTRQLGLVTQKMDRVPKILSELIQLCLDGAKQLASEIERPWAE